ncbi:MAG: phosphatidylglycerophosphatase A family protein [Fusobacteriaceae bacterium]
MTNLKHQTVKNWATWFGLGEMKKAPGTFGTLGGIPVFLLFNYLKKFFPNYTMYNSLYFIFLMTFFMFAVYIADICEREIYKKKDPQEVVIDEVLGFMVTMFLVNPVGFKQTIIAIILGFVIFRIFDIFKPGPINYSQNIGHGVGVVLDDFLAGMIGNFILITIWSGIFK